MWDTVFVAIHVIFTLYIVHNEILLYLQPFCNFWPWGILSAYICLGILGVPGTEALGLELLMVGELTPGPLE